MNHAIEVASYADGEPETPTSAVLRTHDAELHDCHVQSNLLTLLDDPDALTQDIQAINEGQFFPDLVPAVRALVETQHKHVIVCGLDGDFRREKFGSMLDLIPLADDYVKMRALCARCRDGTPAPFSARVAAREGAGVVSVGAEATQMPLCRRCFEWHE